MSAEWMVLADDRILEYLDMEGPGNPAKIAKHDKMPFSRDYINRRLLMLVKTELITNVGRGVYALDDRGRSYLYGEYDMRKTPRPND
jgi:hypothetical protein